MYTITNKKITLKLEDYEYFSKFLALILLNFLLFSSSIKNDSYT